MDRKQILILTLAIVVLVSGIFFVVRSISDKKQVGDSPQAPVTQKPTKLSNMFGQEKATQETKTTDVMGSVEAIGEKTLTVKNSEEKAIVNITGSTPVMIVNGQNQTTIGQLADLKIGDSVKVTYDSNAKNAKLITLMRP